MGVPRLKIKNEIRYRKGSTCESLNCIACKNFVPEFTVHSCGSDNEPIRTECRCRIIGLQHSRRYRVQPDYRCDRQEASREYLDSIRYKGDR